MIHLRAMSLAGFRPALVASQHPLGQWRSDRSHRRSLRPGTPPLTPLPRPIKKRHSSGVAARNEGKRARPWDSRLGEGVIQSSGFGLITQEINMSAEKAWKDSNLKEAMITALSN